MNVLKYTFKIDIIKHRGYLQWIHNIGYDGAVYSYWDSTLIHIDNDLDAFWFWLVWE